MTAPILTVQANLWVLCLLFLLRQIIVQGQCECVVFCTFNSKTVIKHAVLHVVTGGSGFATLLSAIHLFVLFKMGFG